MADQFLCRLQERWLYRRRYRGRVHPTHYDAASPLQERVHSQRRISLHPTPVDLWLRERSEIHLQFFRTLWRLLWRKAERISRTKQLSRECKILYRHFRDVGPFSIAIAQWQFLGCAG